LDVWVLFLEFLNYGGGAVWAAVVNDGYGEVEVQLLNLFNQIPDVFCFTVRWQQNPS
jgi:hypothetical protein